MGLIPLYGPLSLPQPPPPPQKKRKKKKEKNTHAQLGEELFIDMTRRGTEKKAFVMGHRGP